VTELAHVVLDLASLGIGADWAVMLDGENHVWQVSQLDLKNFMAAIEMGDAAEWNRGACYAKSFSSES
jgi:hypothetical protein